MAEKRDNYVYRLETDPTAVAQAARRRQTLGLLLITVVLGTTALGALVRIVNGPLSGFSAILWVFLVMVVLPIGIACLVVARRVRTTRIEIMMGEDFLSAPPLTGLELMKFKNVRRVNLDIVSSRIVGATIVERTSGISAKYLKDPAILVRAIFERAPETVKWRRSWRPFGRLSRQQVRELIDQVNVPDINRLLPPSAHYAYADEFFSQSRPEEPPPEKTGPFRRLFGTGTWKSVDFTSPQIPTPVSRYVNVMLYQMFATGPKARVLRRSEALPTLTIGSETITAPPLEEVLDRLKFMCGLDPRARHIPVEGTAHITFKEKGTSTEAPYKAVCQFDDKSDTCCQIRLERLAE